MYERILHFNVSPNPHPLFTIKYLQTFLDLRGNEMELCLLRSKFLLSVVRKVGYRMVRHRTPTTCVGLL